MYPNWQQNDVDVNGVKIHYTRTGDDSKPALVLFHGFSDNGMCWMPVAQALEDEYDIVLPDAPGHGLSQRLQEGQAINAVEAMAGLIQTLGLNKPVVGGHSMGGNTAGMLGDQYPDLARALILEDPGWRIPQEPKPEEKKEEPRPNPWFDWLKSLPDLTIEEVIAKGKADSPTWPEIEFPAWAESKKQLDLNVLNSRGHHKDWREVVKGICVPTLLITADPSKGSIVTPESAQFAVQQNPRIHEVNIPGAGHNIRREAFESFMKVVREFLDSVK